jgi:phage shock protein A
MEARVLLFKDFQAWTDEILARSEAAQERVDSDKSSVMTLRSMTLRSEAQEDLGASTVGQEELASSLGEVQTTVASLEKGLELQANIATEFKARVQTTLVDMKSRIAGAEDVLQQLKKTAYPQTVSMSRLKSASGLGASSTNIGSVGSTQRRCSPPSLSSGGNAIAATTPSLSTSSTNRLIPPQLGSPRKPLTSAAGAA